MSTVRSNSNPSDGIFRKFALPPRSSVVALALLLSVLSPAANAALVSQIASLNGVCGADAQGDDYKGCTAGEIAVSTVTNVTIAGNPSSCTLGQSLTISNATVQYDINTNSRNDLVMWIGDQDGTDPRLASGGGKTCSAFSVPSPFNATPNATNPWGDVDADQCGDLGFSVATTSRDFTNIGVTCQDNDDNGKADLQVLLTWSQNATQACGTGAGQTFPTVGAISKCDYSIINTTLDVILPLPKLALDKEVSNNFGGNNTAASWTLTADGATDYSGAGGFASQEVNEGTYTLEEDPAANTGGYAAGDWVCTGTGVDFTAPDQLVLERGDNVSCTITNQDVRPGLTLDKTVNNTHGGNDLPGSFVLTLTGADGTHNSGVEYADGATPQIKSNVQYTVFEVPNAGYVLDSIVCLNDSGGANVGNPFTLAEGENVTCTLTNSDGAPSLTVVKSVSGGEATADEFVLHVTGAGGLCGQDGTDDYASGDAVTPVESNCAYTVSESPFDGYTSTGVTCVDDYTDGPVSHPVSLNEGQSVTCTLTNQEVTLGSLTIIKEVENDDGGDAVPGDFTLHLAGDDGDSGNCGEDGTVSRASGYSIEASDDCTYTMSETALAGYTQVGGVSCVDASNGDAPVDHPVEGVGSEQAVVCTITNTDDGALLALDKTVVNTGGGTAVKADWTLNAQGPTPQSGAGGFASTKVNVSDTYALSETGGPLGYNDSAWNCGNAQGQLSGSDLTLNNGDDVTCTITNTAIRPTLSLTKEVINDNDGVLTPGDFTLVLTGADGTHDAGAGYSTGAIPVIVAGVQYTVSETPPEKYSLESIVCIDTDTQVSLGSTFTPTLDQNIACTVTNDDDATVARFRVYKDFTDDNTAEVEVFIQCFTGLPLNQTQTISESRDVVFVVESYDTGELDCDIYELPIPTGYSVAYGAGIEEDGVAGSITTSASACHYDNVEGGHFYCEIVNILQPAPVIINKDWVFVGSGGDAIDPGYKLKLVCEDEILGGDECGGGQPEPTLDAKESAWHWCDSGTWSTKFWNNSGLNDASYTAQVFPDWDGGTHCWVDETVYDDSVEVDNGCGDLLVQVGLGDECTITNTVFYEGIPTLSQYGLAILALLMLGVGLIGFRRYV